MAEPSHCLPRLYCHYNLAWNHDPYKMFSRPLEAAMLPEPDSERLDHSSTVVMPVNVFPPLKTS